MKLKKNHIFILKTIILVAFFALTYKYITLEMCIALTFLLLFLLFPLNRRIPIYITIIAVFMLLPLLIIHHHSDWAISFLDIESYSYKWQQIFLNGITLGMFAKKTAIYIFYLLVINFILQVDEYRKSKG